MNQNISNFANIKPNSVKTSNITANNANLYNTNVANLTCTGYTLFKNDVELGTSQNIVNNVITENGRVRNNFGVFPEITQPYGTTFNLPVLGSVVLFNGGGNSGGTDCSLSNGANEGQIKNFIVASSFDTDNLPITISGDFYFENATFESLELPERGISIELMWDGAYWIPRYNSSPGKIRLS